MKPSLPLLAILFMVTAAPRAQVFPAAIEPTGLPVSGTLHYALYYTQTAQFYSGTEGDVQRSGVTGDVTYANASVTRPFALTYSGGDMWTLSGASRGSGLYYQHLLASQGFVRRSWAIHLSDNVSYMPQAPTTGFSGIPGVGNLPAEPGEPAQTILTLNTVSINNVVSSNFSHRLDHATSLGINSSYGILRFPDGNGLETNSFQVGPQITRRLNARNSLTGQYSFSRFSYTESTITIETQVAMFGFQRTWSRRLTTSASAGPEWIQSTASNTVPSSTDLAVKASASYRVSKSMMASLSYTQAASGGAGVATQIGVHNQDATARLSRQQGKNLNLSVTGGYMRTEGLQKAGVTNGKYGGVSASRRWGRYIVSSANYTAIQQSTSSALPANAISGLSQVVGFSIGYSPREVRIKK
jgi:hypothetical protein